MSIPDGFAIGGGGGGGGAPDETGPGPTFALFGATCAMLGICGGGGPLFWNAGGGGGIGADGMLTCCCKLGMY